MTINSKLKYLPIAALAVAVSLAGCSSSDDDPVASMMDEAPPVVEPETPATEDPETPAELTELEKVQMAAAAAAMAAKTASDAATMAAGEAATARENRADIQTGEFDVGSSGELAYAAHDQAVAAAAAAKAAQDASDAAAAATDVTAATRALVMAEAAQKAAEAAQTSAETNSEDAVAAAAKEVKVVDKTKTVDGTSITFDDKASSSTVNKVTRHTGLVNSVDAEGLAIHTTGKWDEHGRPIAFDTDDDGEISEAEITAIGRTAESPSIAFTYDSANDDARVTLVHSYLGSESQMQFVRVAANPVGTDPVGNPFSVEPGNDGTDNNGARVVTTPTAPTDSNGERVEVGAYTVVEGKILIDHDGDGQANNADAVIDNNGDVTTPARTAPRRLAPKPAGSDFVDASDTKMTATLYYVGTGVKDTSTAATEAAGDDADDGIDQTKLFLERNIKSGETTYVPVAVVEVTVDNATAFEHLHYGLWNGLGGDDVNTITDLGIGFVTAFGTAGMTNPDHEAEGGMPNFGGATYNGNWVANIREADPQGDGKVTRHGGTSSLTADFVKDTVVVGLSGLATLKGDIAGNTFSGDGDPTLANSLPGGLANADDFMGEFKGAFFGPSAAEAGGVFDYDSKDSKNGAFRGSFGGARE